MSKSDSQNDKPVRRVAVTVKYAAGGDYLPWVDLAGGSVERTIEVLTATCRDRLAFLCFGLAVLAKDPGAYRSELNEFADALIEEMNRPGGVGFATGLFIHGFDGIQFRPYPKPDTPAHRRLPRRKPGRLRAEDMAEHYDAVPEIVKAARSENWAGRVQN